MDICNDVMADLARRAPSPTTSDEILPYILRAIDNQVLDTFRKLASQCRDFRRTAAAPIEELRISVDAVTPSQISIRREILDRIRANLPDDEVLAINMMLENRDWHEIGNAIGIKPDAARMKIKRTIDRIREQMARQTGDE